MDISLAFNIEEGISLKDEVLIFCGAADPSSPGEVAPMGSLYLRTNGSLWIKTGVANNQWYNSGSYISAHSGLSGLGADDHLHYMHNTTARTVSAVHTFNPSAVGAPFILGANALNQVVTGLNADLLDGQHGTFYQTASTQLNTVSALASTGIVVRSTTSSWLARTITGSAGRISVVNGTGVSGNPTIDLIVTGVGAGTYNNVTVDTYGRVTAGSTVAYLTGNQTITLTGDTTGSGTTSIATTLSTTGVTPGTYTKLTVDAKGRATVGASLTGTDVTSALGYTPVSSALLGVPNGIPQLDGSGKMLTSFLPALALSDTFVVASQVAMLALGAQTGDVAVRTDLSKSFILRGANPATLTDWQELLTPGDAVTSVNGQTGTVSITSVTGNAGTATALQTARTISLSSDVTGSVSFNGTANVNIVSTLSNTGVGAGTYGRVTVDAKGRVTAGANDSLTTLTDVTLTAPTGSQVLTYDGTKWINSSLTNGNATALLSSWTLLTGNLYYADFAHNLGTFNLVVTLFDVSDNTVVFADALKLTSANIIRVTVVGNTRTLRCVVVANGVSLNPGGSTPASIITKQEGVNIANTPHTSLNFTGNVTVVDSGTGIATINLPGSPILRTLSFPATAFDSPNNADWVINALAPVAVDPANIAIPTRQFSNTIEQGIGMMLSIPVGTTTITFRFKSKSAGTPSVASVVQPRIYSRVLPNNAAVGGWGTAFNMTNISIPTNIYYQYSTQTVALASLGMVAGNLYQIEMTRRTSGVTGGTNLAQNWLLAELTVEFA